MPDAPPALDRPPPAPSRKPQIAVDVSSDGGRAPLGRETVASLVRFGLARHGVRHAIVSIAFVSNRRIAALNRQIMGNHGTTDVISLAFRRQSNREPVIGDI